MDVVSAFRRTSPVSGGSPAKAGHYNKNESKTVV